MAPSPPPFLLLSFLSLLAGVPRTLAQVPPQPLVLTYHNGTVLKGNYTVNLVFYGRFTTTQRSIVSYFVRSVSAISSSGPPSVASWWGTTALYGPAVGTPAALSIGRVRVDSRCSLGKSLTTSDILVLAKRAPHRRGTAITAVVTAADVQVEGFCSSRCGLHNSTRGGKHGKSRYTYLWVGNPATQCPGECAWPFARPSQGPQTEPLVPPNGDVGVDGLLITLATLLTNTVTNPYGDGYFQGLPTLPFEAGTACTGIFGGGAFPGNPGKLLVDPSTKASYNTQGFAGRKYLLPAMWDPQTGQCKPTLV